jgi:hypothetical protein
MPDGEITGRVELQALAEGDEQLAVRAEGKARPELQVTTDLGQLAEDDFNVLEAVALQSPPRDSRRGAALPWLGIGEINQAICTEIRVERHVEQSPLTLGDDLGDARKRLRERTVLGDQPEPPRTFRHQHPTLRQKGETPWVLEPVGKGFDLDSPGLGVDRAIRGQGEESRRCGLLLFLLASQDLSFSPSQFPGRMHA